MGKIVAFDCLAVCIIKSPAITRLSLLASKTVFPALIAENVEISPAAPTIAATTLSTFLSQAMVQSPSCPETTVVSILATASCLAKSVLSLSATQTICGRNSWHNSNSFWV